MKVLLITFILLLSVYAAAQSSGTLEISVLDYNEGFPPDVTGQTVIGRAIVDNVRGINTSVKSSDIIAERHTFRIILTVNTLEAYS